MPHLQEGASYPLNCPRLPPSFPPVQVEIFCVSTGQQARFYYNGWLSKDEPPYQLEVGERRGRAGARRGRKGKEGSGGSSPLAWGEGMRSFCHFLRRG